MTFENCKSLATAPAIPESVDFMNKTFLGCTNLTGIVRINSKIIETFWDVFGGTSLPITLEVPEFYMTSGYDFYNELPDNVTIAYYD